ncbi:hypothetical protein [Streptococcus sp. 20-1249]|uniref:hypothetical protein n=1 Tax=Streptococcus hepaticus TaxID=3349163 RepID=UPI003747A6E8
MSTKRMSRIAILSALAIVLRFAFGAFPNVKPITAIFLVSLLYFPLADSLLIMALTMIGSGIYFGFSIVVLWQIVSFGLMMLAWRFLVLPLTEELSWATILQSILAGLMAFAYGFLISIPTSIQFGANLWIYWLNGLMFDALHAASTFIFYPFIYQLFRRIYREKNVFFSS